VAQIKIPHRTKCNFSTTVWDFYTQISWFIWERSCYNSEFKKKYFSFLQSYGYLNIQCHIFNSARNNQQQLIIFIHVMVSAGVCFGGKERLHFIPDKTKVNAKRITKKKAWRKYRRNPSNIISRQWYRDCVNELLSKCRKQHLEADRIEFIDEDTALQCPCHLRTVIWLWDMDSPEGWCTAIRSVPHELPFANDGS